MNELLPEWAQALLYIGVAIWSVDKLIKLMGSGEIRTPNPLAGTAVTMLVGYLYNMIGSATAG